MLISVISEYIPVILLNKATFLEKNKKNNIDGILHVDAVQKKKLFHQLCS